ncbi:hypothetical protein GCM10023340_22070 [Nocardioides marinquilinus]|uniref:WD40 repeat domain-containing protein n=1 Tax=Nocardioides marinquilinus TaxID=1210400 RepID=A0ABP9PKU9_9ACTN
MLEIKPAKLDRGPDAQVPRMSGRTVVDGDRRVQVEGRRPVLLGRSGSAYVVVSRIDGRWTTQRVAPGRPARTLLRGAFPESLLLSDDGAHLVYNQFTTRRKTVVDVRSARTGKLVDGTVFTGYVDVLGMDGGRLVLGGDDIGTRTWNVPAGASRRISPLRGYDVDFAGDRLAVYTGDPYEGGCTRVLRLSRPGTVLWRSCDERVDSFSPQGRRMVTVGILADGLGPNTLWERATRGRLFARYEVAGWFGGVQWENDSDFVVEAAGRKQMALVRCSGGVCDRASALRPTPSY